MFRRLFVSAFLCLPGFAQEPVIHIPSSDAERNVVLEMSRIRRFPKEYAKYLRTLETRFEGKLWHLPERLPLRTREGQAAVREAIDFLEQVTPIPDPLAYEEGLHFAAQDHVLDQGPSGQVGHVGTEGSIMRDRIHRYGQQNSLIGEVINYG